MENITAAEVKPGDRILIPSLPFGSVARVDPVFVQDAAPGELHKGIPAVRIRYQHPCATFTDYFAPETPVVRY
jgi:hypothetical protein